MSIKRDLYKKFDDVKTRKGRGGNYPYISSRDVFDRMNDVFGINWSSQVESQEIVGNNVIIRVRVSVFDPDSEKVYNQEGYGAAINDDRLEPGSAWKAAYSKALKFAVRMWGVGLYLEEDDGDQEVMTSSPAEKMPPTYTGKERGVPSTAESAVPKPMPPTFSSVPSGAPEPPAKDLGFPIMPGMPLPPEVAMGNSGAANPMPSMPSPKVSPINMPGPDKISDVQKAALHSILNSISGLDYVTLIGEAFEANGIVKNPLPEIDQLTYKEAVAVVKYGNDKWRKR